MTRSAGLLLYRWRDGALELLLAHPGGPLWQRRDEGAWSLPKGLIEPGERPYDVARREFEEETGHRPPDAPAIELGDVRLRSGKVVTAWGVEGDLDPAAARSNTVLLEWPPRSGRRIEVPEVDRVAWFPPDEARRRLNPAQAAFVDRLVEALEEPSASPGSPAGSGSAPGSRSATRAAPRG